MRRSSDFTSSNFKMLLLKLGSELQKLVKKLLSAVKILAKYKLHFHEVECTPSLPLQPVINPTCP